jgi:hypothetical protein
VYQMQQKGTQQHGDYLAYLDCCDGEPYHEVPSEPPSQALKLYAEGVDAFQRLGLPLSALRVYYHYNTRLWPKPRIVWDGARWVVLWRGPRPYESNTKLVEYRRGVWCEFASHDEMKEAGLRQRETKIGPFPDYDKRGVYRIDKAVRR